MKNHLKNRALGLLFVLSVGTLLGLALCLFGCTTTTNSSGQTVQTPDIRLISEVTTGVALASVKEDDRPGVAREVHAVAVIINTLAGGDPQNLQLAIQKELAGWNSPYKPWVQLVADAIARNAARNPNKAQGLLDASQGAIDAATLYE